jgi:hypothetical protein
MRFQAEIPSTDAAILQSLMRDLEIQSNAELLAQTLAITHWLVSERRQGRKIASIGEQGPIRELVAPLLERVAPERELPRVEIQWTPQQVADLAALLTAEPREPTAKLVSIMKGA